LGVVSADVPVANRAPPSWWSRSGPPKATWSTS